MNLQERLERMLDERRVHVHVDPANAAAYRSKLLHEELGDWLMEACGDDGVNTEESLHGRDNWLVRIAGACLYLLHPEDDLAHVDVNALPLPASRQEPFAALAKAFGEHKPGGILVGEPGSARPQGDEPLPEYADEREVPFTVHQRGDGRWRRKPRPDRT